MSKRPVKTVSHVEMQCTGKAWSCRGFDSCNLLYCFFFHRRSWKMMYLLPMFIEIMCEAKFPRFFGSFIAAETLRDVE